MSQNQLSKNRTIYCKYKKVKMNKLRSLISNYTYKIFTVTNYKRIYQVLYHKRQRTKLFFSVFLHKNYAELHMQAFHT